MEHVVFYPSLDGIPAFRRVASLEEAARFVEHLRNVEDVTDFSVHALTSVPLSVRPWYRVEMPFDAQGSAAQVEPVESAEPVEPYEVAPAAPEPVEAPFATLPLAAVPAPESAPAEPAAAIAEFAPPAPVEEFAPVAAVAPVEQLEPMAPELADAVAGGRRSMGFFTR